MDQQNFGLLILQISLICIMFSLLMLSIRNFLFSSRKKLVFFVYPLPLIITFVQYVLTLVYDLNSNLELISLMTIFNLISIAFLFYLSLYYQFYKYKDENRGVYVVMLVVPGVAIPVIISICNLYLLLEFLLYNSAVLPKQQILDSVIWFGTNFINATITGVLAGLFISFMKNK